MTSVVDLAKAADDAANTFTTLTGDVAIALALATVAVTLAAAANELFAAIANWHRDLAAAFALAQRLKVFQVGDTPDGLEDIAGRVGLAAGHVARKVANGGDRVPRGRRGVAGRVGRRVRRVAGRGGRANARAPILRNRAAVSSGSRWP